MVRGCLPSESVSARGAGDGARCACGRRGSELLYSQRHRAFLPSYHPPYCCRSVRSVSEGSEGHCQSRLWDMSRSVKLFLDGHLERKSVFRTSA